MKDCSYRVDLQKIYIYPTLKETSPFVVDMAQGAWYVNATFLCLFDKKKNVHIISRTNGLSFKIYWYQESVSVTTKPGCFFFLRISRTYGLSIKRY